MPEQDPLVLTLEVDPVVQQEWDRLRRQHFARSPVGAHVTLFHALPGEELPAVLEAVAEEAGEGFVARVDHVQPLGRGVALALVSDELVALHRRLRRRFEPWLTRQDAQPLRAHVTLQNKVSPEQARALLAELSPAFSPYDVPATGVGVWHYRGGPWELEQVAPLTG